ncbi:MAG: hypothetical protein SPK09_06390 [Porphyromonas sp.]|nr:hypothetical protein [Porphyromonas sp.]
MHRRERLQRLVAQWLLGMYLCVLGLLAVHTQTHPHHTRPLDHHCSTQLHYHQDHGDCELPTHNLAPSTLGLPLPIVAPAESYVLLRAAACPAPPSLASPRFFSLRAPPSLVQ